MIESDRQEEAQLGKLLHTMAPISERVHLKSEALIARSSSPLRSGRRRTASGCIKTKRRLPPTLFYIISIYCYYLIQIIHPSSSSSSRSLWPSIVQIQAQQVANFPGVSRDLASFCSARPSLSIDLVSMIVHVKKGTSFNYKLYLFSSDNYVFQTGQIVPRDDFRIHSFPVKLKQFNDFLPFNVMTYQQNPSTSTLDQVPSSSFNIKNFFSQVQIDPSAKFTRNSREVSERKRIVAPTELKNAPFDAHGDALPGDETFVRHDVEQLVEGLKSGSSTVGPGGLPSGSRRPVQSTTGADNVNSHIQFDRDDQVAILDRASGLRKLTRRESSPSAASSSSRNDLKMNQFNSRSSSTRDDNNSSPNAGFSSSQQQMIMPVGAFSSFHVNTTYLVRKDFDQLEPELIRLQIDPARFEVTQLHMLGGHGESLGVKQANKADETAQGRNKSDMLAPKLPHQMQQNYDYAFLSHKLLRDPNTRITSINQIYEDWITRNFYTIVYIQRRLDTDSGSDKAHHHRSHRKPSRHDYHEPTTSDDNLGSIEEEWADSEENREHEQSKTTTIVTDRLIFRGSSTVLLGADQLEYQVKASAFITEKNGLHYYLEFLTSGKFYLGAIDWTQRPFIVMDSQRFPTGLTKTLFDNEELLLCPPSVCYSARPIDEIISYGRVTLSEKFQREAIILTKALSHNRDEQNGDELYSLQKLQSPTGRSELLTLSNGGSNSSQTTMRQNASVDEHDSELTYASRGTAATNQNSDSQTERRKLQVRDVASVAEPIADSEPKADDLINLDALIEAIRRGSSQLEIRLHLRDWTWTLPRVDGATSTGSVPHHHTTANKNGVNKLAMRQATNDSGTPVGQATPESASGSRFSWHYEWSRRNDIKVNPDTYGFVLTGHQIDASYRVYNELYLISANHLITINYTNLNETVTSVHPIGDEFIGLSSTLLDPITGAYYDRYANQIYFFKGDRYVGYDYATKKPLEDFLLPPAIDMLTGGSVSGGSFIQPMPSSSSRQIATPLLLNMNQRHQSRPLVSSLPVVGILGRQHHVDAIYHDQHDDFVYIFSGMKFYTFQASDFKDGAFKSSRQPALHCINEHFLDGCRFDEAYSNPCKSEASVDDGGDYDHHHLPAYQAPARGDKYAKLSSSIGSFNSSLEQENYSKNKQKMSRLTMELQKELNFSDEQQLKLRSIAARGGGRLDYLLESTLTSHGAAARAAVGPFVARGVSAVNNHDESLSVSPQSALHERIVIYLLVAMVLITILVTVAMISVIVNWTASSRAQNETQAADSEMSDEIKSPNPDLEENTSQAQMLKERVAYPPAIRQYLSNQYYNRQYQPASSYYHQANHARHQQTLGYLGAPFYHQTRPDQTRRSRQPPPPQRPQVFDALAQQQASFYKSTNQARSASSRFSGNDIIDSSAL